MGNFGAMRLTHLRIRYRTASGAAGPASFAAAWVTALGVPLAPPEWQPPCDVRETADAWTLQAEIGGLRDDELEILVYEDSVVVQGVRPWRAGAPDVRVHLAELRYGPFRFALDLPARTDPAAVRASYDRGILAVVLPKLRGATT